MAVFPANFPDDELSVDVPPFRVYVARVTANSDPTQDPAWAGFEEEPRLKVLRLNVGSSVTGMSHAVLKLAVGQPLDGPDDRLEEFGVLNQGDRVIIGTGRGSSVRMLWAGYQTDDRLNISPNREARIYRLSGPEWIWGALPGSGARKAIAGQIRRTAEGDDAWFGTSVPTATSFNKLANFTDERCIFNPLGRRNMTIEDVALSSNGKSKGRIWEIPDRRIKGNDKDFADFWTKLDAIKTLFTWYNDSAATGIDSPDWTITEATLKVASVDSVLRDINADGLGLWEALRRVIGPEYGFWVDPTPSGNSPTWKGFKLTFFARGQGPDLPLILNPLGTTAAEAAPCVLRVEASKDIGKVVNRVTVLGKYVRHVKLQYFGDLTPTLSGTQKQLSLQHGWSKADGDLTLFATSGVIERWTVESKSSTAQTAWDTKFTADGAAHERNKDIFRLFVWNESGEFYNDGQNPGSAPSYGTTPTDGKWYRPDLTGIADGEDANAGLYSRRRRPLLDTYYLDLIDGWKRVPPSLYMSALDETGGTQGPWVLIKYGHYRFDHERAALWITVEDLLNWRPFTGLPYPGDATITDERNFATLLNSGKLRMLVEGSIETDWALTATSDRTSSSGSPLVREAVYRNSKDYIKSVAFVDGVSSPGGSTGVAVDTSADAQNAADQAQAAGQDQQVHSSITVSASWPISGAIGAMVSKIKGRTINLTSDNDGSHGAQVVGLEMDCEAMAWELLTESNIMKLKRLRRRKAMKRRGHASRPPPRFDPTGVPMSGDGPIFQPEDLA